MSKPSINILRKILILYSVKVSFSSRLVIFLEKSFCNFYLEGYKSCRKMQPFILKNRKQIVSLRISLEKKSSHSHELHHFVEEKKRQFDSRKSFFSIRPVYFEIVSH